MSPIAIELQSSLVLVGAIVSLALAAYTWMASKKDIVRPFSLFEGAIFFWALADYLRVHMPTEDLRIFYLSVELTAIILAPFLGYAFLRALAGGALTPRQGLLLGVLPLVFILILWAPDSRGLLVRPEESADGVVRVAYGPAFWALAACAYVLLVHGFYRMGRAARHFEGSLRRWLSRVRALLLVPVAVNVAYLVAMRLSGISGASGPESIGALVIDPTPLTFAVVGVFLTYTLRRFNFLDSMPFGKDAIFDAIRDPVLAVDAEGFIIGANRSLKALFPAAFGREPRRFSDFCPPAADLLGLGGSEEWRQGDSVYSVAVHPLGAKAETWSGAIVFFYDLTERHRALATLAEREESLRRYAFMANATRDIMSIVNRDLRYEAVNDAYCARYGLTRDAVLGRGIGEVVLDASLLSRLLPSFTACLAGEYRSSQVAHDFHDGRGLRDFEFSFYPYRSASGTVTHAVLVTKDVSDYLGVQRELAKAKEEAQDANTQKGAFLAAMSHEIRTPLNAVIGLTELTLKGNLPPESRDNLETVLGAAHGLLDLINDLLDLSKIEAGRMSLESVDFDLQARVALVVKTFKPAADAKGLRLDLLVAEGAPRFVQGDPLRIGQLVTNLVGNAIKFTDSGGVEVRLSPWVPPSVGPAEVGLRVDVADTGIGIAPEKQEIIFESFSQADSSISRRYGGTGLGLSICRLLTDLLGGSVWVSSELGRGSTFSFTARLARGEEARAKPAHPSPSFEAGPVGRCLRILVVEDNPVNAKVALRWLAQVGHEAAWAASGAEALASLAAEGFDLLLLDIEMPDMDGFEVARRIRAGGTTSLSGGALPIVAMTAHSGVEARQAASAAGMDDYVSKPVDFVELAATLSRVARHASRELLLAQKAPAPPPGLIDPAEPLRRLGGDRDLFHEILAIFAQEAPGRIQAFVEAAASREKVRRLAHSLRGAARTVGAEALAEAAAILEEASGRTQKPGELAGTDPSPPGEGADAALLGTVTDLLAATAREASLVLPPGYEVPAE